MILWTSKETPETRDRDPNNKIDWPCSAYRKILEIKLSRKSFLFGISSQIKWKSTGKWQTTHTGAWLVTVTPSWCWGSFHTWYDGPHCCFSVGFVHFHWWNPRCKKCEEDGFGPEV